MHRIEALDGLRGAAAFVVVLHHCALVLPGVRDAIEATLVLRPFVAGPEAVLVFFVLSGFVLHGAIAGDVDFRYGRYVAARLIRLYPPMLAAVLVSLLLFLIVAPTPIAGTSTWFRGDCWALAPSLHSVVAHLLLADAPEFRQLDNITWSLSYEVRMCLLMPFIVPAVRGAWRPALLLAVIVSVLAVAIPSPFTLRRYFDLFGTMRYAYLFVSGSVLALHLPALRAWARDGGRRMAGAAATVAAIVLLSSVSGMDTTGPTSVGAVLLVAVAASGAWPAAVLRHPALLWLGRISYSLYLVHLIVLMALVHAFHDMLSVWSLVAMTVPVSLLAAEIAQRLVERPAIRLSRRWLHARRRPSPTAACPDDGCSPAARAA